MWNDGLPRVTLLTAFPIRAPVAGIVRGRGRTKIKQTTLDALRTRQSLVKGERLVRHEMRAVLRLPSPRPVPHQAVGLQI